MTTTEDQLKSLIDSVNAIEGEFHSVGGFRYDFYLDPVGYSIYPFLCCNAIPREARLGAHLKFCSVRNGAKLSEVKRFLSAVVADLVELCSMYKGGGAAEKVLYTEEDMENTFIKWDPIEEVNRKVYSIQAKMDSFSFYEEEEE